MARLARYVVPDCPHHVTQRGNRRMTVFFGDDDYALYLDLLAERCRKAGVAIWAYCLMPNQVHLILTPATRDGLGAALGETHRRYSGVINARLRVTGHLFQPRFGSAAMDEDHLMAAARYVALNPVRARSRCAGAGAGLALVERAGASGGARRRLRHGGAAAGAMRRPLRRPDRDRAERRADGGAAGGRDDRAASGWRHVPRWDRDPDRPDPRPGKRGPKPREG